MILRKPCGKKAAAHTIVPPAIMDRERGTRTGVWRLWRLALVLLAGSLPQMVEGYRIHDPNGTEPAPFEPYETGFVRRYGDPLIFQRERVNEGAPATEDQPRIFEGVAPRQLCPNMVGPLNGVYYCRGKEYGYCDQRSGICFCNMGYSGLGCESCGPTHYQEGELCYPKRLCPNDCRGGGTCDYVTGTCQCDVHRTGPDCSQPICTEFDPLCVYCTNSTCLRCLPGYSVNDQNECQACVRFDPRCVSCNSKRCLVCGDPLLLSIRRSGRRYADPVLPFDESSRQLSVALPFGTQLPEFFDEAEDFRVVDQEGATPLNASSRACHQGMQGDEQWTCAAFPESHTVCGHEGTLSFGSPTYAVHEGRDDAVRIVVTRTGGGFGSVSVTYSLRHVSSDASDVAATAHYTTDQTLTFPPGVVQVSFLVRTPDDSMLTGDRVFSLHLTDVSGGALLGPQSVTLVTVHDDDANKTSPALSHFHPTATALSAVAGAGANATISAVAFSGSARRGGGDFFALTLENSDDNGQHAFGGGGQSRVLLTDGWCRDLGSGAYPCTWTTPHAGSYVLRGVQLVPYGLQGDYYEDAFFLNKAFSRVDHVVNFTWGTGRLTETATDFVSIRWHGRLRPNYTEAYSLTVSADDHVRLWLDQQLLIDQWDRTQDFSNAQVNLTARRFHHLVLEYREMRESAHCRLWWSSPSTPFQVVPKVNLFREYEIGDSPLPVTVTSASTEPATTYCQGPGITEGTAGETLWFHVHPRDRYANPRGDASDDVLSLEAQQYHAEARLTNNRGQGRGSSLVPATVTLDPLLRAYRVEWEPSISGQYALNVTFQAARFAPRMPVQGSPFLVTVGEARTFGRACVATGPGLSSGMAGVPLNFSITAKDALHNLRRVGGDAIEVVAYNLDDQASAAYGTVQDVGNGTYVVHLTPLAQGRYDLHVLLRGPSAPPDVESLQWPVGSDHIAASPYRLLVTHNVAHGPSCSAEGAGLSVATAGYPARFVITVRDAWANVLRSAAFNATVLLLADARPLSAHVQARANGSALVTYTPTRAGHNALLVLVNGRHIAGSPFHVAVADGDTKANVSSASGEGLYSAMAGRLAHVTVQAKDAFGNPRTRPSDPDVGGGLALLPVFNVSLHRWHEGRRVEVHNVSTYVEDGKHVVSYNATLAGHYNLTLLDAETGEEVEGWADLTPYVMPAPGDPLRSYAVGEGTSAGTAGALSPVIVQSRDQFGNPLDRGGDLVLASLWGPFGCIEPCRYNRSPLAEPLDSTGVLPLGSSQSAQLPASKPRPLSAPGHNNLLSPRSPFYNSSAGYAPLDGVSPSAYQAVPLAVTDLGDGRYSVPYIAPQTGTYRLSLSLGTPSRVSGLYYRSVDFTSPYLWRMEGGLNLTWGGEGPTTSTTHRHANQSVFSHDRFSAVFRTILRVPRRADYTFHLSLDASSAATVTLGGMRLVSLLASAATSSSRSLAQLLEEGELYDVEVRFQHFGVNQDPRLSLQWSSSAAPTPAPVDPAALYLFYPLANRSYEPLITPAPLHPQTSTAAGLGLTQAVAGFVSYFTLYPRDAQGNLLLPHTEGLYITVIGRGPTGSATFLASVEHELDDGSFNMSYTPLVSGVYSLLVSVNSLATASDNLGRFQVDESLAGAHVQGSPFRLAVSPGPLSASHAFLTGDGSRMATAGAGATFELQPRDAVGNPLLSLSELEGGLSGFSGYLQAIGSGASDRHPVLLSLAEDGRTLLGSYNVTQTGVYRLLVSHEGVAISGGAYDVVVSANAAHGPTSSVDIDRFPQRDATATFKVTARDAWANTRVVGGDRFFAKIFGPEVIHPLMIDQGDGSHLAVYKPRFNGMYNVTIALATQGGLTGQYYQNRSMQGTPFATLIDEQIDLSWGHEPMVAGSSLTHDTAVRWDGLLMSPLNETFTFTTELEGYDVARVWVAGNLVVVHDNHRGKTRHASGSIALMADRLYEVRVELEHFTGACGLRLYWQSHQTPRQVVPSYYLYSGSEELGQSPISIFV